MNKTEKLATLLQKAETALEEAVDARNEVLTYLEETYGIDAFNGDAYGDATDDCIWCFGLNESGIYKLINGKEV